MAPENLTPQEKAAITRARNKARAELVDMYDDFEELSEDEQNAMIDQHLAENGPAIEETGPESDPVPSIADVAAGDAQNPLAIRVPKVVDERLLDKKPYWLGTCKMHPIQNITIGGQRFPHFSGNPNFGQTGKSDRPLELGQEVMLSELQLEHILTAIRRTVIRTVGDRGIPLVRGGKGAVLRSNDEPAAKFVYIVPGRRQIEIPASLFAGYEDEPEE